MGSCISKCKPKKTSKKNQTQQEECKCKCVEKDMVTTITPLVQDKLVISHAEAPLPPPSPSKSSSSSSAYSACTTSNYPTTSSSSSSCSLLSSASSLASSTSVQSSKLDQSFSNEFLWSCVKENPQLLSEDFPIKVLNPRRNSLPIRCHTNGKKQPNRPKELPAPSPQWVVHRSAPQKRPRCNNSPSNLTRQKSFRREPEAEPNRPISRNDRDLRPMSPSSSRRFNGEANAQGRSLTSSMRRENFYVRPQSPNKNYNKINKNNNNNNNNINNNNNNNNMRKNGGSNNLLVKRENENLKNEDSCSSKIEELGVGNLVSNQDMDMMPIEDVNNPHIALDCFIFL